MASSLPCFNAITKPVSLKRHSHQSLQVKAQSFRDEGRRVSIVDANLSVLRQRIEEVVIKERLERCCRCEYGWNYASGYDYKLRKYKVLTETFELVGLIGGTIGLSCLCGTAFLCLISILVHLNQ
ncbi:uncharacterized protein LOC123226546 [Mangifera indica]|uniref:uncharacterized protein LOC123226546 n=1 Tax=Mangifera indica TaxID=29780 RepID=UPI001CFB1A42|nr:uncharacterized protein LOC123226546 [Mangifera indica]